MSELLRPHVAETTQQPDIRIVAHFQGNIGLFLRMSTSRIGAWLGLFALLMLFAGPLLTQAQNLDLMSALTQVQAELSCHSDDSAQVPAEQVPFSHVDCGYCQLVTHFAAVPVPASGFSVPFSAPAPDFHIALDDAVLSAQLLPPPRAPPQSIPV